MARIVKARFPQEQFDLFEDAFATSSRAAETELGSSRTCTTLRASYLKGKADAYRDAAQFVRRVRDQYQK